LTKTIEGQKWPVGTIAKLYPGGDGIY
jgi:hypothetical protein